MNDLPRSTADWMRISPQRVPLNAVHSDQPTRDDWVAEKARRWWSSYCGDVYVHLAQTSNGYRVVDGHHRVAHWRRSGHQWIWARVHVTA